MISHDLTPSLTFSHLPQVRGSINVSSEFAFIPEAWDECAAASTDWVLRDSCLAKLHSSIHGGCEPHTQPPTSFRTSFPCPRCPAPMAHAASRAGVPAQWPTAT